LGDLNISDPLIIETLVSTFDPQKTDKIDSREFITGLAMILPDNKSKLSILFKCYDWKKSGNLVESDVLKLLQACLKTQKQSINLVPLLRKLFSNDNKTIKEEEFIKGVLLQEDFNWLIKPIN